MATHDPGRGMAQRDGTLVRAWASGAYDFGELLAVHAVLRMDVVGALQLIDIVLGRGVLFAELSVAGRSGAEARRSAQRDEERKRIRNNKT